MPVQDDKLKVCPTLLIGLGGTGKDILLRVRKQFYDRWGQRNDGTNDLPILGYLVIDTDNEKLDEIAGQTLPGHVRDCIRLQDGGSPPEVVVCRVTSAEFNDYFTGRERVHPHIFSWMPSWMGSRYQATAMETGAGQNRLFGRLAFFHFYDTIRSALKARLQKILSFAVSAQKPWLPAGADLDENRIEVMLVYSLAGGTGCGMFLDAGFLVRSVLEESFKDKTIHVTHFAFLPQVLTSDQGVKMPEPLKTKVHENAFAALKEMEYLANRQQTLQDLSIPPKQQATDTTAIYQVRWKRDGEAYQVKSAPWDTCYLIDSSNDPRGGAAVRYADLYQMVAEYIYLDFDLSDFGGQKRSARSNLKAQTELLVSIPVYDQDGRELFQRNVSRKFSTFGLSQIQFDRDRLRRAAAYRLAGRLVEWWVRRGTTELVPEQLSTLATDDLGKDDLQSVPTRTTFDTDRSLVSLSSVGLQVQLLRRSVQNDQLYTQDVDREATEWRTKLETDAFDALSGEPFTKWMREHQQRLTLPGPGVSATAAMGETSLGFQRLVEDLEPRIDQRVEALFRHRIEQLGVRNAATMFERYATLTSESLAKTDAAPPNIGSNWSARYNDARQIWMPSCARVAAKSELLRAVDVVKRQIKIDYQKAVTPHLKRCLDRVRRRVVRDGGKASYGASVDRFHRLLDTSTGLANVNKSLTEYLGERFTEYQRNPTTNQLDSPIVTLMEELPNEKYDEYLAEALKVASLPELRREQWQQIEEQVFKWLQTNTSNPELERVDSVANLALKAFPIDRESPVTQRWVDEFAEELARACETLLSNFTQGLTALSLFERHPNQPVIYEHLRKFSAPFLRRNIGVQSAQRADIDTIQMLGMADDSGAADHPFVRKLRQTADNTNSMLTNLKAFRMADDAIVVYQEKAGVPLLYSYQLNELGEKYDASTRPGELHLDRIFAIHAPEIRWVNVDEQKRLSSCLELALVGMMTDQIRYLPDQAHFSFNSRSRYGVPQNLGGTLDRVMRTLSVSSDLRNDLVTVLDKWYQEHEADEKMNILWLWSAHWDLYFEIRERVSRTIAMTIPGAGQHPLLGVMRDRMVPQVRKFIPKHCEEQLQQLQQLVERADYSADPNDQQAAIRDWKLATAGKFRRINEEDLPIPVLIREAKATS